ncbi:MAG: mechanosensitive ion channel family protein [Pseudodesulfovibrio sp.]
MNTEYFFGQNALPYLSAGGAVFIGITIHALIFRIIKKAALKTYAPLEQAFVGKASRPGRLLIILLLVEISFAIIPPHEVVRQPIFHALGLLWIIVLAWMFSKILPIAEIVILSQLEKNKADDIEKRKVITQFNVFKRITYFLICILALATMLMTFESMQKIGMSILASAGVAGIVVGMSAKNTLSTVFSGIQFAITQPVRLDDVVIIENEWGTIEEITLTYVVVRIWDERRLIVPIDNFLTKPFQNWSRNQTEIMGTAFIHADYTVPVEALRLEAQRIVSEEGKDLWDGRYCGLQVTDTSPDSIELRVLVTAADAPKCWDLRCLVRENLINFMKINYPDALPQRRLVKM